jgi:opacity protein-like surface antigen
MRKITTLALGVLLGIIAATPALAQDPASESWHVKLVPYFLAAGMNGTSAVAGQEVTIDMSYSDIAKNLQFGAMGLIVARKGNWGVGGDGIWMSLGANGTGPGQLGVTGSVDINQGAFAFYGLRRLGPAADVMFGGRVNMLQSQVRINGPNQRSVDGSKTWFDPIVGLQLHTPEAGNRWHAQVYSEIGGFGVGSSFTWQVFPTVGVNLTKRVSVEFGYRWLSINYSSGEDATLFKYDVRIQGPVIGFGFRF